MLQSNTKKTLENINKILKISRELFLKSGIENVKMTDIAMESEIGVATLYRYFGMKKTIVIRCGVDLWNKMYTEFKCIDNKNILDNLNGYESLKKLLLHYKKLFVKNKEFFIFIKEFDYFCLSEKITKKELKDYENSIMQIHNIFLETGKRGIEDRSIRSNIDLENTYFAAAISITSVCQKWIIDKKILESDSMIDPLAQLQILLESVLYYLKRKGVS